MKVRYSRAAAAQIRDILEYISAESPNAAIAISARLVELVALIAKHPEIGRPTNRTSIRVFRISPYPYLVFYRIELKREGISILKVRHTSRAGDWRNAE